MIYNNYTAKPLWKDLKSYDSVDRTARRYITAPNPGRDSSKCVPLYKFLLKTNHIRDVRVLKSMIHKGEIKVNNVIVKELKHPLQYYDYLTVDHINYIVIFKREQKLHEYHKVIYIGDQFVLPVARWFLKDGLCMVNTYQNKMFSFTPSVELFTQLRVLDSVIYYNPVTSEHRLSTLSEKQEFNQLIKLTGKQIYQKFLVDSFTEYDNKINLILRREENSKPTQVILPKSMFRARYLPYVL